MFQVNTKSIDLNVPPRYLHEKKTYIMKKLKELEKTCTQFGFINEIIKIKKIDFKKINNETFVGDVIFTVRFDYSFCNPQQGDIIPCTILQTNEIIIGKTGPLIFIIHDGHDLDKLDIGDEVNVEVIGKRIKISECCINIVGKRV